MEGLESLEFCHIVLLDRIKGLCSFFESWKSLAEISLAVVFDCLGLICLLLSNSSLSFDLFLLFRSDLGFFLDHGGFLVDFF